MLLNNLTTPVDEGISIFALGKVIFLHGKQQDDELLRKVNGKDFFEVLKDYETVLINSGDGNDTISLESAIDPDENGGKVGNVSRAYVYAGEGDDLIVASKSVIDDINGGPGFDMAVWGYGAEFVDMVRGLTYSKNGQVDKFSNIESILVNSREDVTIVGNDDDNEISAGAWLIVDATDHLYGGGGNDTIDGGGGLNYLEGGAGADEFVIRAVLNAEGVQKKDVITDFEKGVDKIVFKQSEVKSIDDLEFFQTGNFTLIRTVDDCIIQVDNMVASQLDSSDFIF